MSRNDPFAYDHHYGEPPHDYPVGTRLAITSLYEELIVVRDDDGWRIESTDNYLHWDLEHYDFDALYIPEETP